MTAHSASASILNYSGGDSEVFPLQRWHTTPTGVKLSMNDRLIHTKFHPIGAWVGHGDNPPPPKYQILEYKHLYRCVPWMILQNFQE